MEKTEGGKHRFGLRHPMARSTLLMCAPVDPRHSTCRVKGTGNEGPLNILNT